MATKHMYIVTCDDTNYIVVNVATLRSKKIGRIGKGRGVNYMDRAKEEATRRNGGIKAKYLSGWEFEEVLNGTRSIEHIYE